MELKTINDIKNLMEKSDENVVSILGTSVFVEIDGDMEEFLITRELLDELFETDMFDKEYGNMHLILHSKKD